MAREQKKGIAADLIGWPAEFSNRGMEQEVGPSNATTRDACQLWLPGKGVTSKEQAAREEVSIDCLRGHRPAKTPGIPNVARRGVFDPRG